MFCWSALVVTNGRPLWSSWIGVDVGHPPIFFALISKSPRTMFKKFAVLVAMTIEYLSRRQALRNCTVVFKAFFLHFLPVKVSKNLFGRLRQPPPCTSRSFLLFPDIPHGLVRILCNICLPIPSDQNWRRSTIWYTAQIFFRPSRS